MEEQASPSAEYLKGFNEGYLLSREAPSLADKLSKVQGDNERTKGFLDGRRQFVIERAHQQRDSHRYKDRSNDVQNKTRDKGYELDKE